MPEEKSLEQFLQELLEKERERHEQFRKEHNEIMQMIEDVRKKVHKHD